MMKKVSKLSLLVVLVILLAVLSVLSAAAQEPQPQPISEETAGANGIQVYNIYVSAPGNGKVGGINYADEDVLRYTTLTNSWTMFFDGSAAGLPGSADIDAISLAGDYLYMSFDKPVQVPGLGTVDDSDVVVYNTKNQSWHLNFIGATDGLTTNAEDIDALVQYGSLAFSTVGHFSTNGIYPLEGEDEDLFSKDLSTWGYSIKFDGSNMGLASNNISSAAYIHETGSFYLVLKKGVNLGGIKGAGGGDIWRCHLVNNQCQYSLFWDASKYKFPKVDALDIRYTTLNLP